MGTKLAQYALEVAALALRQARKKQQAAPVAETMKKMFMVIDRMDPAAYQRFYNSEYERWGRYIRAANISLD